MDTPLLHFHLSGFPEDTLHVVRFSGNETLSELFRFELLLVSEKSDLDLDAMLSARAELHVHLAGRTSVFKGVVTAAEHLHQTGRFTYYHLEMAPRLQRLALASDNRIFLDKTLGALIQDVLESAGWEQGTDYSLKLEQDYEQREFICQYDESNYTFLARTLEQNGVLFFFDQQSETDTLVITDSHAFQDIPGGPLEFKPVSGMDPDLGERVLHTFGKRLKAGPGKITLRDVNYRLAPYALAAEQLVPGHEQNPDPAELHLFAPNAKTEKECRRQVEIMAQRLAYEQGHFTGAGACPEFRPGRLFELKHHHQDAYNQKYLITGVAHHGHQEGHLAQAIGLQLSRQDNQKALYANSFTACPENTPYRPARQTRQPCVHGFISAKIDGEGSGEYAEIDAHGRYKVILPFDLSGRKDGKASTWLRMNQPYAGSDHGMHLPLHKGCEVALLFLDGNPDRPVIAGALPNSANASPVTLQNPSQNIVSTAHGNLLQFEDRRENQHLLFHNKTSGNYIRLGAPPRSGASDSQQTQQNNERGTGPENKS